MIDAKVNVPPDSTGSAIDNSQVTTSLGPVLRQRQNIADHTDPAGVARVLGAAPGSTDMGLVVRQYIPDGQDPNAGTTTDAAITTNAAGSLSGKIRGLVAILADVWDSVGHALKVAIQGTVNATVAGTVAVSNFPGTQAVSGTVAVSGSVAVTSAGLTNLDVALSTRLKPADTLAAVTTLGSISGALPAGTNILGRVGIDQTTDGTTNKVNISNTGSVTLLAGVAVIGHVITDTGSTTAVTGNVAVTNAGLTNIDVALSTRALESGGNLATLVTRTPVVGAAVSSASRPVVLATDQVQSKTTQPVDTDLGLLVRSIQEDNALTQSLLQGILSFLTKVFGMSAAAGTPVFNVQPFQATAGNLNVTISGALTANQSVNLAQIAATALANVTGLQAPSASSQTAAVTVVQSQSYHPASLPMHIYDPGALVV